jgi:hypothetical protein
LDFQIVSLMQIAQGMLRAQQMGQPSASRHPPILYVPNTLTTQRLVIDHINTVYSSKSNPGAVPAAFELLYQYPQSFLPTTKLNLSNTKLHSPTLSHHIPNRRGKLAAIEPRQPLSPGGAPNVFLLYLSIRTFVGDQARHSSASERPSVL